MANLPQELDHLRITFDDIKSATNNFATQNFLGQGGFGPVYKGRLPSSTCSSVGGTEVAVKQLNVKGRQGRHEFLMEIFMLASYKHDNLVSLVGFCDDSNGKLLVYKHEVNGSLDNHLSSINLTWEQRLQICLGAAQGLEYLHGGVGVGHRVLHRDIKSSNILLDAHWEAKISDFGLSTIGPTNQQLTFLVTDACGTFGYVDPVYVSTGVLTKESDVYSFGVVLFEVLCGRPAMIMKYEDERKFLSALVKFHKEKGTLDDIIMSNLVEQMDPSSLQAYSDIAFQCLNEDRKQRPTMGLVVKALETALKHQLVTGTTVSDPQFGRRTQLWGSVTGGVPFLFQIESHQRLSNIKIYYEGYLYAVVLTMVDSNGSLCCTYQFGGLNLLSSQLTALELFQMSFDADEEIIKVFGTLGIDFNGEYISSLGFVTNKKRYGPIGKTTDTHFSGSWKLGLFEGFYGRSGIYVYALGCCLKTVN